GVVVLRGNPDFESEDLLAWELGFRTRLRPDLTLDLALFDNVYDNLRSQELPPPGTAGPVVLGNELEGETRGVELAVNAQTAPWWRWHASYTYLDKELRLDRGSRDPTGGRSEGNDPSHLASLRSSLDLGAAWELDVLLRYVDELPFPPAPAVTEMDLRLGWRAMPGLELSLIGQNLLHDSHVQFRSGGARIEEVERSVYGRVTWRF
ncbi:MAG TPA: TonB-dependent receptor, partial [Thermoanaerobaculia bacterium]|nr:TonB-dependent receptor [Thermoanaerobaculia bacterium]